MARLMLVWLLGVGVSEVDPTGPALARFQFSGTEMAVPIEVVLYAPCEEVATTAFQAALARFHQLNSILSDYDPQSELSLLSRTSGEGKVVPISNDLWQVLSAAQGFSEKTSGAFDVTVGPVVRLWRRARRQHELPGQQHLQEARAATGYRHLRLSAQGHTAELLKKGMRLDVGGIAKGYATVQALAEMRKLGIRSAMVHAGGDTALGDPRFVSAARIDARINRPAWSSTTPYLSVLLAPNFAPARLVVDPGANYFWISCATATENLETPHAVSKDARALLRTHACLHR
jgi:thiamine biosynthesis lipoprotein